MCFDVNFPAVNHPEMASDSDSFTGLFLTYYCKALSSVRYCKSYFFHNENWKVENKERLVIEYSIRFDKNRTFTHKEINVLLRVEHESLPSLAFHNFYNCKCIYFFEWNNSSMKIDFKNRQCQNSPFLSAPYSIFTAIAAQASASARALWWLVRS